MTVGGQALGDGSTSEEKLHTLLAVGVERDDLDFKEHLDLSAGRDKLELVKDFAAMQSIPTGGYVVVGADDRGRVTGQFGQLDAAAFDPANLTRIAHPYLPTVRVSAATHQVNGVTVAVIYIGPPEPPGVAVIAKDGQYQDGKKSTTVFAPGDVFVRRGTQSVRWLPGEVAGVLQRWEESIREDERRRATAYAQELVHGEQARTIASGPLGSLTWRLASEDFDAALLEAMRADDSMLLRRLSLTFAGDATSLAGSDEPEELDLLLDRLLAALALSVTYEAREWLDQLLDVLVDIYSSTMDGLGNARQPVDSASQKLMLRIAVGVEAVGGLAVRLGCLWAVRPLAMPAPRLERQIREPSLIRHAVTAASRAQLLVMAPAGDGERPREIGGPIVALARQLVERIPALRPDAQVSTFELNSAPDPVDRVLDSLIQFDVLWCVIAVTSRGRDGDQYPSFASFYAHRAEPAFELLIDDHEARALILGGGQAAEDAEELEAVLRTVATRARSVAQSEGRWGWWPESERLTDYLGSG